MKRLAVLLVALLFLASCAAETDKVIERLKESGVITNETKKTEENNTTTFSLKNGLSFMVTKKNNQVFSYAISAVTLGMLESRFDSDVIELISKTLNVEPVIAYNIFSTLKDTLEDIEQFGKSSLMDTKDFYFRYIYDEIYYMIGIYPKQSPNDNDLMNIIYPPGTGHGLP